MAETIDRRLDPGPIKAKEKNWSPLRFAIEKRSLGNNASFCPYGCDVRDLDDFGYCKHLVGFTRDGKTMDPMVLITEGRLKGRRLVIGDPEEIQKRGLSDRVLKSDHLERISCDYRVYRENCASGAQHFETKPAPAAAAK